MIVLGLFSSTPDTVLPSSPRLISFRTAVSSTSVVPRVRVLVGDTGIPGIEVNIIIILKDLHIEKIVCISELELNYLGLVIYRDIKHTVNCNGEIFK